MPGFGFKKVSDETVVCLISNKEDWSYMLLFICVVYLILSKTMKLVFIESFTFDWFYF